jgi:hypothetical protein
MNEINGLNAQTAQRLLIGPGAVYLNYGLGGQELLGATRGGCEYNPGIKLRTVAVDAPNGDNIKGLKRLSEVKPMIKLKSLEFSLETMRRFGQFTATVNGVNDVLVPREVAGTDYWTNVAVVGTISGSTDPVILLINNALANPETINIKLAQQDEVVIDVEFMGHWDPAAMTVPPVEIRIPTIV